MFVIFSFVFGFLGGRRSFIDGKVKMFWGWGRGRESWDIVVENWMEKVFFLVC